VCADCKAYYESGERANGAYILANGATVYCDMADGGWTVFLRRVDNSWDFKRTWYDYVTGFGDVNGNLWVGLDTLHAMTAGAGVASELHVYMDTFEGESAWARYSTFSVGAASSQYQLSVGGYSGTAGDAMAYHNGMRFTTTDYDNDASGINCAVEYQGGWWYNDCYYCNPTGLYLANTLSSQGATWTQYKVQYSLKTFIFKIRRI
jgi:ficolin